MLTGQIALVTGATRGIGAGIAKALASQGALVIGTATTENGANSINEMFVQANLKGQGLVLDVTNPEQVDSVVRSIGERFGDVTILVNNAGITRDTLFMRMKFEDWQEVINTNLNSIFRMSQAVLKPMMKARYGRIINITSLVAHMGNPGQTNYAAAKAGVAGFTKTFAAEIASRGITVNCVAPGFIHTDMTSELPLEVVEKMTARIPVGRFGNVNEIAATVAFLASPNASYITGETIHVNGGLLMS